MQSVLRGYNRYVYSLVEPVQCIKTEDKSATAHAQNRRENKTPLPDTVLATLVHAQAGDDVCVTYGRAHLLPTCCNETKKWLIKIKDDYILFPRLTLSLRMVSFLTFSSQLIDIICCSFYGSTVCLGNLN